MGSELAQGTIASGIDAESDQHDLQWRRAGPSHRERPDEQRAEEPSDDHQDPTDPIKGVEPAMKRI